MNVENQIIGSLLMDSSRIYEIRSINSEMFSDPILGEIFSLYEHADGKEINQLVIAEKIKSEYWTQQRVFQLLADIVNEHDAGISDGYCEDEIKKRYMARLVNDYQSKTLMDYTNIEDYLDGLIKIADSFNRNSESNIQSLSDLTKLQSEYFNDNKGEQFKFGFEPLDKAVGGIDKGDVTIIAARPAVGKSAFALQVIREYGRNGIKVGYFNLEMSFKQVYERSIASASGIDMTRIRLATTFLNDEKDKFDRGNELLAQEKNVYVISGTQTIKSIRAIQKQYNFQVIVIDYLQLITPSISRGNRVSEVGEISRGLKAIATDFNIPVIALSQLNRASDKLKDKEPHMSELRESGDLEQDASVIIMLWNSNDDDATEKTIKVEKSRNGFNDRVVVYFDGKHMKFKTDTATDFENVDDADLPWS